MKLQYLLFVCLVLWNCSSSDVSSSVPVLVTEDVTNIMDNSAVSGGNISSDGGKSVTARGVVYSINPTPTLNDNKTIDGAGGGKYVSSITNLLPETSYFVRAYATNQNGTGYGIAFNFKTTPKKTAPILTTTSISAIGTITASSGGTITSDGGSPITARGICWSISTAPTIANSKTTDGSGIGTFTSSIVGLVTNTTYYVRAYATNSIGTSYGNELNFKTLLADGEGNIYSTVSIGTQIWLKENLRTSKYANGELIPTGVDWGNVTTGAWSYPNDNATLNIPYGKLYNWYAVTDARKVCPNGYHVPTDNEWTILETFLGGSSVAGGKLKESGTTHWMAPNTGADNSSGFTGLPGGNRRGAVNSIYETFGTWGRHWTATQVDADAALGRDLVFDGTQVVNGLTNQFNKKYGFSVRCLKD